MANIEEIPGVFGGVKTDIGENPEPIVTNVSTNLPAKVGFWNKVKSVLFYEVKVELTPYQQKIEDEINDFLYQDITWGSVKNFMTKEISWSSIKDFLFQEVTFGKKDTKK